MAPRNESADLGTEKLVPPSLGLAELLAPFRPLRVRYAAEELICREGTFAAGLQWIVEGLALETEAASQGAPAAPPDLLVPGDMLGTEILLPLAEERHRTTCRALTETSLLFLDRGSLGRAVAESPEFAARLIGHLALRCAKLRRARSRLALDPTARLAATLADLSAACEPVHGGGSIALPEVVDARVLGEISGLSPLQMRRGLRDVPDLSIVAGRIVFQRTAVA